MKAILGNETKFYCLNYVEQSQADTDSFTTASLSQKTKSKFSVVSQRDISKYGLKYTKTDKEI